MHSQAYPAETTSPCRPGTSAVTTPTPTPPSSLTQLPAAAGLVKASAHPPPHPGSPPSVRPGQAGNSPEQDTDVGRGGEPQRSPQIPTWLQHKQPQPSSGSLPGALDTGSRGRRMSGPKQISFSFRWLRLCALISAPQPGGKEAKRKQKLMKGFVSVCGKLSIKRQGLYCGVEIRWAPRNSVSAGTAARKAAEPWAVRGHGPSGCAWLSRGPPGGLVSPPTHAWMLLSLNCQMPPGRLPGLPLKQEG